MYDKRYKKFYNLHSTESEDSFKEIKKNYPLFTNIFKMSQSNQDIKKYDLFNHNHQSEEKSDLPYQKFYDKICQMIIANNKIKSKKTKKKGFVNFISTLI